MHWYLRVLRQYAVFNGRAHRREYWLFFRFNVLVLIALILIVNILLILEIESASRVSAGLFILYWLATITPYLAVTVRRLHDTGRSGWWLLIAVVPLIGGVVLLILLLFASESGQNKYGPDPNATAVFLPSD